MSVCNTGGTNEEREGILRTGTGHSHRMSGFHGVRGRGYGEGSDAGVPSKHPAGGYRPVLAAYSYGDCSHRVVRSSRNVQGGRGLAQVAAVISAGGGNGGA